MYTSGSRGRGRSGRGTPSKTSGICCRRSASPRPTQSECPSRCPSTRARRRDRRPPRERPASDRRPVIVVHVSAGNPFRRWPRRAFAELAAPGLRDAGRRVIVDVRAVRTGRRRTRRPERAGAAGARRTSRAQSLSCGDLARPSCAALLDRAALFIGGDSGPLHIAATTATPIVGLYGPTLARALGSVAQPGVDDRIGGGRPAVPSLRSACLRAGRFPLLDADLARAVVVAAERARSRPSAVRSTC